jgi:hypothetical protein
MGHGGGSNMLPSFVSFAIPYTNSPLFIIFFPPLPFFSNISYPVSFLSSLFLVSFFLHPSCLHLVFYFLVLIYLTTSVLFLPSGLILNFVLCRCFHNFAQSFSRNDKKSDQQAETFPVLQCEMQHFTVSKDLSFSSRSQFMFHNNWSICLPKSKLYYDRQSWYQAPIWDPRPIFPHSLWFSFFDSFGLVDVGRPLWREVGSVLFSFCRASPAQLFSDMSLVSLVYCLYFWDSLNQEGQIPVFISPRNRVAQLYPRAIYLPCSVHSSGHIVKRTGNMQI